MPLVVCVDVGSTFTKAASVDVETAELVATAAVPTTANTDVLIGLDEAVALVGRGHKPDEIRVCSSAGGGLRLAVIGFERAITAEAGRRVGLSAGARVVHVAAGVLGADDIAALVESRPDIVLLCGGTDGGDESVLLNARAIAGPPVPVVVACNSEVAQDVGVVLGRAGTPYTICANVLPRIGVLDPAPARDAIRTAFIAHVIGGKHLSAGPRFARLVRCATPDAVLSGVAVLADGAGEVKSAGDVVVVDVGGATTDVYSVVAPDPDVRSVAAVGELVRARTVEGDLGMRYNAPGIVLAAAAEGLAVPEELAAAAARRAADPGYVPDSEVEAAFDAQLARLAVTVAIRRHARPFEIPGGSRGAARDLRRVRLAVGSGGVMRHASESGVVGMLTPLFADVAAGWPTPEHARLALDARYSLAPAGLLAPDLPEVAARLLESELKQLAR